MLIPLLLISMCIVLAISVDVSTICLVLHSYMIKYQYVHVMLMFYFWINIIEKLPRFLTMLGRTLTKDNLIKRGWGWDGHCMMCCTAVLL
jgi:hypothetical protein